VGHGSSPLIIHVPHAATWIPTIERDEHLLDDSELEHELRVMTDWYTGRMAQDALAQADVPAVIFANRASRLVIDPERFIGDDEPMRKVGMVPVYVATSDGRPSKPWSMMGPLCSKASSAERGTNYWRERCTRPIGVTSAIQIEKIPIPSVLSSRG